MKEINDDYGHAVGDAALLAVAQVLQQVSRRSDVTARLGGDEFAVLATETPLEDAVELAGRVHEMLRLEPGEVPVTVSIGIAAITADVPSGADMIRAADRALYDAKVAGRDGTAVAVNRPTRVPPQRRGDRIAT